MLTTKNITPHQGENYYTKENYYSLQEQQENSQWIGQGAASLGLKGKIEGEKFFQLLHGYLPNGEQFRSKPTRKGYKERAGLDCTFSAPKSASILALSFGEVLLEKAHRTSVERTLSILEERYATTRIRTPDGRTIIRTGNLVIAMFHHDSSRALDPHLHTHCVILNMTQLKSGKWQSLCNDDIHHHKKLLGMIYQNELAIEVQKLGYAIEQTGNGQFEIVGFKREQIEYFSKRHFQIKALLKEGMTWGEKELVWAQTRIKKGEPIPRHELQEYWKAEAEKLGIEFPMPNVEAAATRKKEVSQNLPVNAAVAEGIGHCSERLVAFKLSEIEKFVLSEVGNYSLDEILLTIAQSDELLYLDDKRVTTQEAIKRETATILLMEQGKGQVKSIANPDVVSSYLEEKGLTSGQKLAISLSATTRDQFIAWQGVAGAGKTYALNQFKALAQSQNYVIKGFAPSTAAASVLADELGIETTTTARLLFSKQPDNPTPNQIWIVDEAGLLSAVDGYELLKRAQAEEARVILVGDTRQQGAVEAGSPFRSLQQAGIATAYLDEPLRQKTADLKESVKLISEGHLEQGIQNLDRHGRIAVIEEEQHLQNQIVSDYLALDPEEREKTLVLTGTNAQRLALAKSIRDGLKAEGRLGAEGVTITQLLKKDLTDVQMGYPHHYDLGDVVTPVWDYKRLGLSKEQLYTVVGKKQNTLTLESNDGTTFKVNPAKIKAAVYTKSLIEIALGDKMKWTRNERHLKRHNGLEFTVKSIDTNALSAQIQYLDGREDNIDLTSPQHLDYTVVTTNYSSQGKSAERVLVAAVNALDSESFYVAVSRVKLDLRLYTADVKKLIENALKSRKKENPIELLKYQVREQIKEEQNQLPVTSGQLPSIQLSISNAQLLEVPITPTLQPSHFTTPIPQVKDSEEMVTGHWPLVTELEAWQKAVFALKKSEEYIQHVFKVCEEFLALYPKPLPPNAVEAMKRDLEEYRILQLNQMQPDALWEHFSAGIDLKLEALRIGKIAQNALRDGLHRRAVRFMLLESPYFKDIERKKGRTIAERLAREVVMDALESDPQYLWEKEAIESTASALKFLYLFGTLNADRVLVFEGKKFLLVSDLKTETTTITARDGMREILRVEVDKVITFNPTPEERQLLSELRKDIADIEQQVRNRENQLEIERNRGRGFNR